MYTQQNGYKNKSVSKIIIIPEYIYISCIRYMLKPLKYHENVYLNKFLVIKLNIVNKYAIHVT